MKFLSAILSAAPLLASGTYASPLGERGAIQARAPTDYNIDTVISQWMAQPGVRRRLKNNCDTNGGWEGWAQVELDLEFKDAFNLKGTDIREQGKVYGNAKFADFVLPRSPVYKGMVIELKCENKTGQKKAGIGKPVGDDKEKNIDVVGAYSD